MHNIITINIITYYIKEIDVKYTYIYTQYDMMHNMIKKLYII